MRSIWSGYDGNLYGLFIQHQLFSSGSSGRHRHLSVCSALLISPNSLRMQLSQFIAPHDHYILKGVVEVSTQSRVSREREKINSLTATLRLGHILDYAMEHHDSRHWIYRFSMAGLHFAGNIAA